MNLYSVDPTSGNAVTIQTFSNYGTLSVVGSYVYVKIVSSTSVLYRFQLSGSSTPQQVQSWNDTEPSIRIFAAPSSQSPNQVVVLSSTAIAFCDVSCGNSAPISLTNVSPTGVYVNGVYYYINYADQSIYTFNGNSATSVQVLGSPTNVKDINLQYHPYLNSLLLVQRNYAGAKYYANNLLRFDLTANVLYNVTNMCTDANGNCGPNNAEATNYFIMPSGTIVAERNNTIATNVLLYAYPYQQFAPTTTTTTSVAQTTTTTAVPSPTPAPVYVNEIGVQYEVCELDYTLPPTEIRPSWVNQSLALGTLGPGQTIYGVFQAFDAPSQVLAESSVYARINFDNLPDNVIVGWRQVHPTASVPNKISFFSMNRAQRQLFYQQWLPGTETHFVDISYPQPITVSPCQYSFYCGMVEEGVQIADPTDVLPIFIFSVTNNQATPLSGETNVFAYVGDKTPNCRNAPVGIVLGSLWTAAIFIIIVIVVVLLAWEKIMLQKQGSYIPTTRTPASV
jgi:hypothetical protein